MNKTKLLIIFALVYFFSPNGLSSLPGQSIAYLLKDVLKLTAAQAAYFSAIAILGWAIKPLWGIVSDTRPIFGSRRKNYLVLVSLLAAWCWFSLALAPAYTIWFLLIMLTLSSFAYAFQDVVADAMMIEVGKKEQALAEFQSVQWLAVSIAQIITGVAGGWAAARLSFQTTFGLAIFFPLIVAIFAFWLLPEAEPELRFKEFKEKIKVAFFNKQFLLIILFLFLWNFSPAYGTPFFYYMVDELKFSKLFIGILGSMGAVGAALGAIAFKFISPRVAIKNLLIFSIFIGGLGTFFSLIYLVPVIKTAPILIKILAVAERLIFGPLGMVAFLTMLTYAGQKTETLVAGTMFAFLTSIINLGAIGSQFLGGFLYDKIGLAPLIIVSGVTSWLILFFVPFLKTEDEPRISA